MFQIDLDTLIIDCDPHPVCARLRGDKPLNSSLNPIVERVLLDSDDIRSLCEAQDDSLDGRARCGDNLFDDTNDCLDESLADEDDSEIDNEDC